MQIKPMPRKPIIPRWFPARAVLICLFGCIGVAASGEEESLDEANRLLRVTSTGELFESASREQAREIIRTYSLIVASSADRTLPRHVRDAIAECYSRNYAWENFSEGIARILANHLSEKELRLLIGIYQNRGLPPMEIETFRQTVRKGDAIAAASAEYIYDNSTGCVDNDARLIKRFLAEPPPEV